MHVSVGQQKSLALLFFPRMGAKNTSSLQKHILFNDNNTSQVATENEQVVLLK